MNLKRINWGLSIVAIVTLGSFIWTKVDEIKEDNFEYGKDFNGVRDSLNVPAIEGHWITHESSPIYRHWAHPGRSLNTTEPVHFYKISRFDSVNNEILSETDAFHYETEDSVAFRVVYGYQFYNKSWDCKLIKYWKETYPPTESRKLTVEQADSVINNWGLSR